MNVHPVIEPFHCEEDRIYRELAKTHVGSHALADFRKCPLLFRRKRLGLIPDSDSAAYAFGRAAHVLILEGEEQYLYQYAVGGPVNPKTGFEYGPQTKAWEEYAAEVGRPVISTADDEILRNRMGMRVREHKHAAKLLEGIMPEATLRDVMQGIPCQIRVDAFSEQYGIVDLKTCDTMDWFEADARRYGYLHQIAFYAALYAAVTGCESYPPAYIIAVEKNEPYRIGVWQIGADSLVIAAEENNDALSRLRFCQEKGHWPTGYEDLRVLDLAK